MPPSKAESDETCSCVELNGVAGPPPPELNRKPTSIASPALHLKRSDKDEGKDEGKDKGKDEGKDKNAKDKKEPPSRTTYEFWKDQHEGMTRGCMQLTKEAAAQSSRAYRDGRYAECALQGVNTAAFAVATGLMRATKIPAVRRRRCRL